MMHLNSIMFEASFLNKHLKCVAWSLAVELRGPKIIMVPGLKVEVEVKYVAVLPGYEILRLNAILEILDRELQVQPAGVDLTVREVYKFKSPGLLGFSNNSRRMPEVDKLEFDDSGKLFLEKGAYKVRYNEVVRVPRNCIAIGLPRSSLMRMGATIISALWDPGYEGRGEGLLLVENPHGIILERNARVMQLIFVKLESEAANEYKGSYMYEGLRLS